MQGSVGTDCSQTFVGGSSRTLTASWGRASAVASASALSLGKPFMPMQAECVQTGDMSIFSALCSHVIPACFLAESIIMVTSSLVIIAGTGNESFIGLFLLSGSFLGVSQPKLRQPRVIVWPRSLWAVEFAMVVCNRHIVDRGVARGHKPMFVE